MQVNWSYFGKLRDGCTDGSDTVPFLTAPELGMFVDDMDPVRELLWRMMGMAGAKIGEALEVRPNDVERCDDGIVEISLGNGTRRRRVPIVDERTKALVADRTDETRLIGISRQTATAWLASRLRAVRKGSSAFPLGRVETGTLRRSFAVNALIVGTPPATVTRWLGSGRNDRTLQLYRLLDAGDVAFAYRLAKGYVERCEG